MNSSTVVGELTLGTRVMKEELIACSSTLPLKKSKQSWYISSLIIFQHFLKKTPLKPSGPGALIEGIFFMTLSISCLVKGPWIDCKY
jgi:hypothetical protein